MALVKIITNRFNLPAVNLNLLDVNDTYGFEMQIFDQRLRQYGLASSRQKAQIDWLEQYNWGNIGKYEIDKCSKFYDNAKYMKYIVAHQPRSVILCRDTGTVIVPSILALGTTSSHVNDLSTLQYQEIQVDVVESIHSQKLYPASSCLEFVNGEGAGSVEIEYCTSWDVSREFDPVFRLPYNPFVNASFAISIGFTMNRVFGQKVRFTGSHKCFAANGTGVRLFFEPDIVRVNGNWREATWWRNKNRWVKQRWVTSNDLYYVVGDLLPKFYCVSSDKGDLKCNEPTRGIEHQPVPGEEPT